MKTPSMIIPYKGLPRHGHPQLPAAVEDAVHSSLPAQRRLFLRALVRNGILLLAGVHLVFVTPAIGDNQALLDLRVTEMPNKHVEMLIHTLRDSQGGETYCELQRSDDLSSWSVVDRFCGNGSTIQRNYPSGSQSEFFRLHSSSPRIELKYIDANDLEVAGGLNNFELSRSVYYKPKVGSLNGFHPLAYCGVSSIYYSLYEMPEVRDHLLVARDLYPEAEEPALKPPTAYILLGEVLDVYGGSVAYRCWRPVPPVGYVALGDIYIRSDVDPTTTGVHCVLETLTLPGRLGRTIHLNLQGLSAFRVDASNRDQTLNYSTDGISVNAFRFSAGATFPEPSSLRVLDGRCVLPEEYLTAEEVEGLIETHGPSFVFHNEEVFFPDHPAATLDDPQTMLEWCVIDPTAESNYDWFSFIVPPTTSPVTASTLLQNVETKVKQSVHLGTLGFSYYIKIPAVAPGNLARAKAMVHVRLRDHVFTELQFWIWYPFNGPARARTEGVYEFNGQLKENGRHFGDWENVTLTFLTKTKELKYVEMSRHSTSQIFARSQAWGALTFNGNRPVVYVAKYSHAHYPLPGLAEYHYESKVVDVYLYDLCLHSTAALHSMDDFEVVASHYPGYTVDEPDWLKFDGRWGQYILSKDDFTIFYSQKEVGKGPTGPAKKVNW